MWATYLAFLRSPSAFTLVPTGAAYLHFVVFQVPPTCRLHAAHMPLTCGLCVAQAPPMCRPCAATGRHLPLCAARVLLDRR